MTQQEFESIKMGDKVIFFIGGLQHCYWAQEIGNDTILTVCGKDPCTVRTEEFPHYIFHRAWIEFLQTEIRTNDSSICPECNVPMEYIHFASKCPKCWKVV